MVEMGRKRTAIQRPRPQKNAAVLGMLFRDGLPPCRCVLGGKYKVKKNFIVNTSICRFLY